MTSYGLYPRDEGPSKEVAALVAQVDTDGGTTPLTRARKTLPSFDQTFTKLAAAIRAFDLSKVRYEDVQRSAVFAAPGD